jgi:hypothetical protein
VDEDIVIGRRYNGPPDSANGGYACGVFARRAAALLGPGAVTVTLHTPPPLDSAMVAGRSGRRVNIWHGDQLIATVGPTQRDLPVIDPVTTDQVADAERSYPGRTGHPFPTCFVCGVERPDADGLFLAPGTVAERPGVTACSWTADPGSADDRGTVPDELVWALLDCPGGWTADPVARPMVLGRLTTRIDRPPRSGERCVVVGRLDSRTQRTAEVATTMYGMPGEVLARAVATWIALDPAG